jgi:hypothetical protein
MGFTGKGQLRIGDPFACATGLRQGHKRAVGLFHDPGKSLAMAR